MSVLILALYEQYYDVEPEWPEYVFAVIVGGSITAIILGLLGAN